MFFSDVLRAPSYPSGFIPLSLTIQSALRKNRCRQEPSILVLTKGIVGSGDENAYYSVYNCYLISCFFLKIEALQASIKTIKS